MLILKVQYFPLSDGKLSRIFGHQPQLRWPPDLNFGRQTRNLVVQATILVDKIEPCLGSGELSNTSNCGSSNIKI